LGLLLIRGLILAQANWRRPILGSIARPAVAGCRNGGLPFVEGVGAVIGTARN